MSNAGEFKSYTDIEKFTLDSIKELSSFSVSLEKDPVEGGLVKLTEQMAVARSAYERAAALMATAIFVRERSKRLKNLAKAVLDSARAVAMSENEEVAKGRDAQTRAALADLHCKKEKEEYDKVVAMFDAAEGAVGAIEVYWRSFRDLRSDLAFQLNVVRQRVEIGEIDLPDRSGYQAPATPSYFGVDESDLLKEYGLDGDTVVSEVEL